jgi:hypothetical protein
VIPLSAAQTIEPGDALASSNDGPLNEQGRRRIEIRLRRPVTPVSVVETADLAPAQDSLGDAIAARPDSQPE